MSLDPPASSSTTTEDIVAVERNAVPRKLVGLQGHYKLQRWLDAEGSVREFACEILKISPHALQFTAPAPGAIGDWVEVRFEQLGRFEGPIVHTSHRVLGIKIFGTNEDRLKIANMLSWITDAEKPDKRRFPRIVPSEPVSAITQSNGSVATCELMDYSMGGAAVYAEISPAQGAVVKIGTIPGIVVRHFPGGFAVAFLALHSLPMLEGALFEPKKPGSF
jgi:hypothetical protein